MKFFLLLGMVGALWAQNPPAPDCFVPLNRTTAGASAVFDNRFIGCVTWTLVYQSSGFSGLTLTFQSATGAVTAGTFGTYTGTITGTPAGINPNTSTTGAVTQFSNTNISTPWVRMNLSGLTGSGTVNGVLYGYKTGYSAGNGGGAATVAPPIGAVQFNLSNAFGGSASFIENVSALPVPGAPSLATAGTAGATTWGYKIVGRNLIGGSAPSAEATIATGNATLDGTNFINVTVPACPDARVTSYDVWRTTAGGTPATTGLIATNVACSSVTADQGLAVILPFSGNPTSTDTSVGAGSNQPYVNTSMGSAFGCQASGNLDALYPFTDTATGLGVYTRSSCSGFDEPSFVTYQVIDTNTTGLAGAVELEIQKNATASSVLALSGGIFYRAGTTVSNSSIVYKAQYSSLDGNTGGTANAVTGFSSQLRPYDASIIKNFTAVAQSPHSVGDKNVAYHNDNWATISPAATNGNYSHYSEGGTSHWNSGAAGTVAFEIERASMQTADLQRFLDSDGSTVLSRFDKNGSLQLLSDTASPFIIGKMTASAVAPGAAKADLRWLAGTNANTCKLVANAGTSATEVTIVDNVGAGC